MLLVGEQVKNTQIIYNECFFFLSKDLFCLIFAYTYQVLNRRCEAKSIANVAERSNGRTNSTIAMLIVDY